jgi:hypothetical protein
MSSSILHIVLNTHNKTEFSKNLETYYVNKNVGIGKASASYPLDVSGNINVNGKIKENNNELLPYGSIMMWSGTIATIPGGWSLCNGTNGTPDLRDRFIVGAGADSSGVAMTTITGSATKSGGSKDATVVAHSHSGSTTTNGNHSHQYYLFTGSGESYVNAFIFRNENDGNYSTQTTGTNGSHFHTFTTNSTGVSSNNANLPPYYALAFIMKTI